MSIRSFFKKAGKTLKGWGSAIIGGIGDYFTGKSQQESAERLNAENIAMQKEFAQSGVRWKVEDATAAGVHPLFALGAQTQGFTPSQVVPEEPSKAGIGLKTVASSMDSSQRSLHSAQLKVLASQVGANDAAASEARSRAMLNLQALQNNPAFPTMDEDVIVRPYSGAVDRRSVAEDDFFRSELGPHDVPAGPGSSHSIPGMQAYDYGTGPVWLPVNLDDLQDMDTATRLMIVQANRRAGTGDNLAKLWSQSGAVVQHGGSREKYGPVGPGGGYMPKGYRPKGNSPRGWSDYGDRY